MAFYNEIFIEEQNELKHFGSCTGSDSPCYFKNVKNIDDWNRCLTELKEENGFYPHDNKHPFPWSTYKTSDNLIVLRKTNRKWFEFWKPTHEVFVSIVTYEIDDDYKSYFVPADIWVGDGDYAKEDLVIFNLPVLKRN